MDNEEGLSFIQDGHYLTVAWDKDRVWIDDVVCPNEGSTSLCNRRRTYCVVHRFIEVYGTECNVGRTVINGPIEIAWLPVYGESDIDHEFKQIWVCPVDDPNYLASQRVAETPQ
jgi:hypothetical protein